LTHINDAIKKTKRERTAYKRTPRTNRKLDARRRRRRPAVVTMMMTRKCRVVVVEVVVSMSMSMRSSSRRKNERRWRNMGRIGSNNSSSSIARLGHDLTLFGKLHGIIVIMISSAVPNLHS
jgi:hypothetical protein